MSAKTSRNRPRINSLHLLAGLLATGLSVPALLGQSAPFPTYEVGANQKQMAGPNYPSTLPNPWVVSNGQVITPAGTQVYLGVTTRAKVVVLNPNTKTRRVMICRDDVKTHAEREGGTCPRRIHQGQSRDMPLAMLQHESWRCTGVNGSG
jgi:hypothetical protein